MAKLLKSFFSTDSKRKTAKEGDGEEDGRDFTPPMDGRRNLSISRSGRMRQANKKRGSLTLDVYGKDIQTPKPKSREYHVNAPIQTAEKSRRHSLEDSSKSEREGKRDESERRNSADAIKTPEEEIELAFEIIDKIS